VEEGNLHRFGELGLSHSPRNVTDLTAHFDLWSKCKTGLFEVPFVDSSSGE